MRTEDFNRESIELGLAICATRQMPDGPFHMWESGLCLFLFLNAEILKLFIGPAIQEWPGNV